MIRERIFVLYPNIIPEKVDVYISMAVDIIYDYLLKINIKVKKEDIISKYSSAVTKLICNSIDAGLTKNIKQKSQGSTSVTYSKTDGLLITDDIISLLPSPRVMLMG